MIKNCVNSMLKMRVTLVTVIGIQFALSFIPQKAFMQLYVFDISLTVYKSLSICFWKYLLPASLKMKLLLVYLEHCLEVYFEWNVWSWRGLERSLIPVLFFCRWRLEDLKRFRGLLKGQMEWAELWLTASPIFCLYHRGEILRS